MKKPLRNVTVILLIALAAIGCHKREQAGGAASTATIAPAQPQPTQTDSADLTQTVNVEDGRSEAEGAALNDTAHGSPAPATATTATTATTGTVTTTTTR